MTASPQADLDALARFRARFPALESSVHLASCSQGALSVDLNAALFELQHSMRADGAPWGQWAAEVERARAGFARLINADPEEVAIVSCASEGVYHVASSRSWSNRPKVVSSDMEFPSVAHVWLAQQDRGAQVVHVGERGGTISAEDYCAAVDEQTGMVSIPLVSYRNGARMPVAEVARAAGDVGAKVFIDGYQATGVTPVDVQELDCDYFVSGALKYLLGLPGLAFLYVRGGLEEQAPPQLTGWFGQRDPFAFDPRTLDFAPGARRFQTGTPSIPSAYAANAGLAALTTVPMELIAQQVSDLVNGAHDALVEDGERIWSPADPALRGPMVALEGSDPDALAAYLADRGFHTSPRGHVLRLSFHGYNTPEEVDSVRAAIRAYRSLT